MQLILDIITAIAFFCGSIVLYVFLMKRVLPMSVLRIRHDLYQDPGRGLARYTFEGGRAVLCEPRPHLRKYIPQYLLLVKEGYKHLICRIDESVHRLTYSVVMFNNRDRILDILDIEETTNGGSETAPLLLHGETSYIALLPTSFNGKLLPTEKRFYRTPLQYLLFFVIVGVATQILALLLSTFATDILLSIANYDPELTRFYPSFRLASFVMGVLSVLLVIRSSFKKGIGIALHGKKTHA